MSGPVHVEDYAVSLLWFAICSAYTALLAFTALAVIIILRNRQLSILKSQRSSRTAITGVDVDFDVASPNGPVKYRLVNFSRRNDVAECITNEASTTSRTINKERNQSPPNSTVQDSFNTMKSVGTKGKCMVKRQIKKSKCKKDIDSLHLLNLPTQNGNYQFVFLESEVNKILMIVSQDNTQPKFCIKAHQKNKNKCNKVLSYLASDEMSDKLFTKQTVSSKIKDNDDLKCLLSYALSSNVSQNIEVNSNITQSLETIHTNESDTKITDKITTSEQDVILKQISNKKTNDKNVVENEHRNVTFEILQKYNPVNVKDDKTLFHEENGDINTNLDDNTESNDKKHFNRFLLNSFKELKVDKTSKTTICDVQNRNIHILIAKNTPEIIKNKIIAREKENTKLVFNNNEITCIANMIITPPVSSLKLKIETSEAQRENLGDILIRMTPINTQSIQKIEGFVPENNKTVSNSSNIQIEISFTQFQVPGTCVKSTVNMGHHDITSTSQVLSNNLEATIDSDKNVKDTYILQNKIPTKSNNEKGTKQQNTLFENKNLPVNQVFEIPRNKKVAISYENGQDSYLSFQSCPNSNGNHTIGTKTDNTDLSTIPAIPQMPTEFIFEGDKLKTSAINVRVCDVSTTQDKPLRTLSSDTDIHSMHNSTPKETFKLTNLVNTENLNKTSRSLLDSRQNNVLIYQAVPTNINIEKTLTDNFITFHNDVRPSVTENQNITESIVVQDKDKCDVADLSHEYTIRINKQSVIENTNINLDINRSSAFNVTESTMVWDVIVPTSKGDEFQASSEKITGRESILAELENPYGTSHSRKAPKVHSKRAEEQIEPKGEKAIKSISYDKMASSSTKLAKDTSANMLIMFNSEAESDNDRSKFTSKCKVVESIETTLLGSKEIDVSLKSFTGQTTNSSNDELLKSRRSVLKQLLDMTESYANGFTCDKSINNLDKSPQLSPSSNDSIFIIMKDSDENVLDTNNHLLEISEVIPSNFETQNLTTNDKVKFCDTHRDNRTSLENKTNIQDFPQLALEYKDNEISFEKELLQKLHKLRKSDCEQRNKQENRYFEKIVSSNICKENKARQCSHSNANVSVSLKRENLLQRADNTKELLEILSQFTDKTLYNEDEEDKALSPIRMNAVDSAKSVETQELLDIVCDERNKSLKSIPYISEDLASMLSDDAKSDVRIKNGVMNEISAIKKTAFGETEYMKDSIAKVIPSFNIPEGIKELMDDLVKPMADMVPFETARREQNFRKHPSTSSMQIQANLITSSQIDIDSHSFADSSCEINHKQITPSSHNTECKNRVLKGIMKQMSSPMSMQTSGPTTRNIIIRENGPDHVLVFDHRNPLNNVLLAPIDFSDAHRYNPKSSLDNVCESESNRSTVAFSTTESNPSNNVTHQKENIKMEKVSPALGMENRLHNLESGDSSSDRIKEVNSMISTTSKSNSIRQNTDAKVIEIKDMEVNTVVAMKGTKELLETSSSLTLVDDADIETSTIIEDVRPTNASSLVQEIFKTDNNISIKPDISLNELINRARPNERTCSPNKSNIKPMLQKQFASTAVKMRTSYSSIKGPELGTDTDKSQIHKYSSIHEKKTTFPIRQRTTSPCPKQTSNKSFEKVSPKQRKVKRQEIPVTVQQLLTQYNIGNNGHDSLNTKLLDVLQNIASGLTVNDDNIKFSGEVMVGKIVSMSTLCDTPSEMHETEIRLLDMAPKVKSKSYSVHSDWQPELINELRSNNLITECESSANVVAKIDMLPFMGSRECEWESSGTDAWSFLLLHARIRLAVRFAHRLNNAPRTCVRADTPLLSLKLDTIDQALAADKKNSLASLCVKFATEAMRHMMSRGYTHAGQVCTLLRRCAAVARVALRWGRVMKDASSRLAYTVSGDIISFKVANIPLRSIWETKIRMAMSSPDPGEVPWPFAVSVWVETVVADCEVLPEEVSRALGENSGDWGHIPRALWRIFRYLKHKTGEEDLLLGLLKNGTGTFVNT